MNRRSFLGLFAGAAAAAIVAPKVSYFFAPQGGWQSCESGCESYCQAGDLLVHPTYLTMETVRVFMAKMEQAMGAPPPPRPWAGWNYLADPKNKANLTYRGIARA